MKKHKISWLNIPGYIPQTWNPIVGCSKISDGCRNCYAERMAARLASMTSDHLKYDEVINCRDSWNGETLLVESALQKPLGWKKPRSIFVNSMGDLFHENTPDEWIDRVFAVMALCPQHLFIVLTKRADRMAGWFSDIGSEQMECVNFPAIRHPFARLGKSSNLVEKLYLSHPNGPAPWPLPNVWLGVTAENQAAADERIPHLLRTPAAVRFVSCEPMIGAVIFSTMSMPPEMTPLGPMPGQYNALQHTWKGRKLDWVICGGESGPGARPMNPEWAMCLSLQCSNAGVPFFFKQFGDKRWPGVHGGYNPKEKCGGDRLGHLAQKQWHEFPEVVK
jgi:protein gp37